MSLDNLKLYFSLLKCILNRAKKNSHWPDFQWILGHRGARQIAPENTLTSFSLAMELGADGVEFDVLPSSDGVLVVIHDDTLQRTSNGTGLVWEHSFKELASLDATKLKPGFAPEGLPSLLQALEIMPDKSIVNIELKNNGHLDKEYFIKLALDDIKKHQKRLCIIVSSFDADFLLMLRKHHVSFPISLLLSKRDAHFHKALSLMKKIQPDALHLSPDLATYTARTLTRLANMRMALWTINDPLKGRLWFARGIDGIFSDCVKEMVAALKNRH